MTDPPAHSLGDRYGGPAPWRRTAVVLASGLVGVLALSWLAWTMYFHAAPDVSSELVGWEIVDDHLATARIDVAVRGNGGGDSLGATCQVRAIATDHTVVGEASFTPTDGPNEVEVRTERRATAVENVGCTAPGQPRPR